MEGNMLLFLKSLTPSGNIKAATSENRVQHKTKAYSSIVGDITFTRSSFSEFFAHQVTKRSRFYFKLSKSLQLSKNIIRFIQDSEI